MSEWLTPVCVVLVLAVVVAGLEVAEHDVIPGGNRPSLITQDHAGLVDF